MSENVLCFLCFLVAMLCLTAWLYLGLRLEAHKGGGKKLKAARRNYEKAKTWDQKIVYFVFGSMSLLKVGFWGFLTAITSVLLSCVAAICGYNPFPYILEIWDRILQSLHLVEERQESSVAGAVQ